MRFSAILTTGLVGFALSTTFSVAADAPLPREVENEQILGINKEKPHATLMPYATLEQALAGKRRESPYARSLNGDWSFYWVPRPEERPVDFYKPEFDVSGWKTIPVPSCWQLQGYGPPDYTNFTYPFQPDWPRVLTEPPKNYTAFEQRDPVGSYRRDFEVPADWAGRRVFITFDGVDSDLFLWVNGQRVGYSVNSRAPAEFDLTPYLKAGKNVLAAEVYKVCAGSYLEDQDMWRLSGIFRNVTLWSAPSLHLRDFSVQPDFDADYRDGTLNITEKVKNYGADSSAPTRVSYALYGPDGQPVSGAAAEADVPALAPGEERTVTMHVSVPAPAKWTAETPNLYTSILSLASADAAMPAELLSCRTGFRKVEIKGNLFEVNGVPIKLLGFNRHENEADTGHTVTEENMVRDLKLLKGCNCNHVRTCHYQDDPRWYELCDEYGIYLVAEANLESHGSGWQPPDSLSFQSRWEKAHVQREVDNVETHKNHAAVVIWSLGNESGWGPNFDAATAAVKKLDRTRPVHYEGWQHGSDPMKGDLISQMYTSPTQMDRALMERKYDKPFYLCEFAHAMNNSMGGLKEYLDVINKYPGSMGGAIWEWQDQALWNRRDPAHPFLAYGGGFGDDPNDSVFILKGGGVFTDRTPNPKYPEVKHGYQWIKTRLVDGKLEIDNKYAFTNLSKFKGIWTISREGRVVQSGELAALNVPPGNSEKLDMPSRNPDEQTSPALTGSEEFLRVAYQLKADELWAKAGTEIASDQFELPSSAPVQAAAPAPVGEAKFTQDDRQVVVSGPAFQAVFDKGTGALSDLIYDGFHVIAPDTGGLQLNAYRAPHLNDDLWAAKDWKAVGLATLERRASKAEASQVDPATVKVQVSGVAEGKGGFGFAQTITYTLSADGAVTVETTVTPHGRRIVLPRIGARVMLNPQLDHFTYFGRGPMENYPDRKLGSDIGLYDSTVTEQLTPYVRPMECGNHEDVRWCKVTRGRRGGPGVMVVSGAEHPLSVSALPYADEQLEPASYAKDLTPSTATVLCLSARTLGVGSSSCGPRPFPAYQIFSDPVSYSYTLKPVVSDGEK